MTRPFLRGAPGQNEAAAEAFLRIHEPYCTGACSRFINRTKGDVFWLLQKNAEFILWTRRCLFPVCFSGAFPFPRDLKKLLAAQRLHAAQGQEKDIAALLPLLEQNRILPAEAVAYDLMELSLPLPPDFGSKLRWRKSVRLPEMEELPMLFSLQEGYEREEVIPKNGVFNKENCLKTLQAMLGASRVLAAESGGRLVGKININAESWSRLQIGGVYVDPAYRGRGIAAAMTAAFIRRFSVPGKHWTLFVRKNNLAAQKVYKSAGFKKIADYKIVYFF